MTIRYEYLPPVWVQQEDVFFREAPEYNDWELQTPFGMMRVSKNHGERYTLSYCFAEKSDEGKMYGDLEYLKKVGLDLIHNRMETFLEVID